jgi:hypothetical protein
MIAIKIQCGCGQKYAFDVEPVAGRMPWAVTCPVCGDDGTSAADSVLAQSLPAAPVAMAAASGGGLRVSGLAKAPAPASLHVAAPTVAPSSAPADISHRGQGDRTQAVNEARAKVSWGDSEDEVIKALMIGGFNYQEAKDIVAPMYKERAKVIRRNGIKKIFIGIALACVPVVALFIFLTSIIFPIKLFAVTVMIGLYGLWLILKGIIMMVAPKSEPGDVAEQ